MNLKDGPLNRHTPAVNQGETITSQTLTVYIGLIQSKSKRYK